VGASRWAVGWGGWGRGLPLGVGVHFQNSGLWSFAPRFPCGWVCICGVERDGATHSGRAGSHHT